MIRPKPFVKWPGGKRRLLPELVERLPETFDKYYEPFLGGGALYFHLQPKLAFISDINYELVNAYNAIKFRVELLMEELEKFNNNEAEYYFIRSLDRQETYDKMNSIQKAARFIYLNKTCFNGLYRVNSKGQFNVPFGKYENPTILDRDNLLACNKSLHNTVITCESFRSVVDYAERGDFVYFDPPYVPDGISSTFTSYTKDGFGMHDQEELVKVCDDLNTVGVKWMLSNSAAPVVYKLYERFNIEDVNAPRSIGASSETRKKVGEVIVRNYE